MSRAEMFQGMGRATRVCVGLVSLALVTACSGSPETGGASTPQSTTPASQALPTSPPEVKRAGPLGLSFGMSETELKSAITLDVGNSPGSFSATTVPTPHPAFEAYQLVVGGALGLCKLAAVGKDIRINSFGTQLKKEFDALVEEITQKYGPSSERVDRLLSGSIWDEPEDWSMAVSKQERYKYTIWKFDQTRDDKVSTIELSARASDSNTGYLVLIYNSGKSEECEAEAKKARKPIL